VCEVSVRVRVKCQVKKEEGVVRDFLFSGVRVYWILYVVVS